MAISRLFTVLHKQPRSNLSSAAISSSEKRLNSNRNLEDLLDVSKDPSFPRQDLIIVPDFISTNEEQDILKFIESKLKRVKYSKSHFDQVIDGYRELALSDLSTCPALSQTVRRMKSTVSQVSHNSENYNSSELEDKWKPLHVLDLSDTGRIASHVDNVDYSGGTVSGLCLLSSAVMTLRPVSDNNIFAKALLPRRCLYITKQRVRYEYQHEISSDKERMYTFKDAIKFRQERRISLILRDIK